MLHSLFNSPCWFLHCLPNNQDKFEIWSCTCEVLVVPYHPVLSAHTVRVFSIPLCKLWVNILIESIPRRSLCRSSCDVSSETDSKWLFVSSLWSLSSWVYSPCGRFIKPYSAYFLLIMLQMPIFLRKFITIRAVRCWSLPLGPKET